jgi:hypothetical protein
MPSIATPIIGGLVAIGVVWLALMFGACAVLLAEALPVRRRRERPGVERAARDRSAIETSRASRGTSPRPTPAHGART